MKKDKKEEEKKTYPIQHWSTSSMIDFLSNPIIFKKRWIMQVPDDNSSMSAILGKACHLALQTYFGGNEEVVILKDEDPAPKAIQTGLDWIDKIGDHYIRYGKTGSREELLKKYTKAINWYISEMPKDWNVVSVEETMSAPLKKGKTEFAIPMKGKLDILIRKPNGRLRIIDHKFVSSYTDPEEESPIKIIQAMFLKYLVWAEHNEEPEDIVYRECKVTENRDGTVQTKEWGIRFDQVPHYDEIFMRLYDDCTKALSRPDVIFLPNVRDNMNGEESFLIYKQNLLGVDMSDVEVDHNTHHVRYKMRESTFSASMLDTADSSAYAPEERVRVKLAEFGVPVKSGEVNHGPSVTLYTFTPSRGVSVAKIEKHAKDIALALRAESVRIVAPIPGTNNIGIEVPRQEREMVKFNNELIEVGTFNIPIGIDLYGNIIKKDIRKMPHIMVAGATGSGKSVFINSIIHTLSTQQTEENLIMTLIDPKQVELAQWEKTPNVKGGIISTVSESIRALENLVNEMERRYTILKEAGAKSIEEYSGKLPYHIVVIDEFADLIMSREKIKTNDLLGKATTKELSGAMIETSVVRLAQKGRAAGIHLVIGTQRPSVDVLPGILKANIPVRVAFMTASQTDSRVIIDSKGAEDLIGKGDMLFSHPEIKGLIRLQGFYF